MQTAICCDLMIIASFRSIYDVSGVVNHSWHLQFCVANLHIAFIQYHRLINRSVFSTNGWGSCVLLGGRVKIHGRYTVRDN